MSSNAGIRASRIGPTCLSTSPTTGTRSTSTRKLVQRMPGVGAVDVHRREVVAEDPGVPQEGEPDREGGGGADRAHHHADRLVLPLVDVVHVDDVDRRHHQGRRDEREGEEAERAGHDRDQDPEAERPAVGLRRRPGGQRHQRADDVERRHRLAGLEREALPALAAAPPRRRAGARSSGRSGRLRAAQGSGHRTCRSSHLFLIRRAEIPVCQMVGDPGRAGCLSVPALPGHRKEPSARCRTTREKFRFRPDRPANGRSYRKVGFVSVGARRPARCP